MKLTELESALATVGNSGVEMVIFEFPNELNVIEPHKVYPLVYWDLKSFKGAGDLREGKAVINMNCFILKNYDGNAVPAIENLSKFEVWDSLQATFALYVAAINSADNYYQLETKTDWELYDAGIISVDFEIGLGFSMKLKAHC